MSSETHIEINRPSRVRDVATYMAMALVTIAAGAFAYFEFGLTAWLSAFTALTALAVLAGIHLGVTRYKPALEQKTDIDQLEVEIAKLNALTRQAKDSVAQKAMMTPPRRPTQGRPAARKAGSPSPGQMNMAALGQPRPSAPPSRVVPPDLPIQHRAAAPALNGPSSQSPREADVEVVQGLVRQLADKVSAAEAAAGTASREPPRMEGAIEASLEALRATANAMRSAVEPSVAPSMGDVAFDSGRTPDPAALKNGLGRLETPKSDAHHAAERRASLIGEALSSGRADVTLEPILNIEDRRARHYNVALHLKAADGSPLACAPATDTRDETFGPALDGLRLARTAQLARRLSERGKPGFVFFEVSAAALNSDRFLAEFAALYHEPTAWVRQLVPALTQREVAKFANREWDALRNLGKAGLCFALKDVETLDMNLLALKPWGFEFAQVSASHFLSGLPQAGQLIVPADAVRILAAAGLTPILSGIDDEAKIPPVLASGAFLGFGPLFGAPRPVRADALQETRSAA